MDSSKFVLSDTSTLSNLASGTLAVSPIVDEVDSVITAIREYETKKSDIVLELLARVPVASIYAHQEAIKRFYASQDPTCNAINKIHNLKRKMQTAAGLYLYFFEYTCIIRIVC